MVKKRNPRSWQRRLDLGRGDHDGHRQAAAQGLRQGQHVRHDAVALEGVHGAGPAHPGLRLVDDQQHPALLAELLEPAQVAERQLDDAAGGQDRLDQAGCQAPGRLLVDHRETELELALPVVGAVAVPERGPVGVGGRQREVPGHRWPVAVSAGGEGGRGRTRGHAVPRAVERDDLVAAGGELGDLECRLVGLGTGAEQHRHAERVGQRAREPGGQVDDRPAEHPAVEVVQGRHRLRDGPYDGGVRVPEHGTHLARGEVQDRPAVLVVDVAPRGPLDDPRREGRAVAHHVALDAPPELVGPHGSPSLTRGQDDRGLDGAPAASPSRAGREGEREASPLP